MIRGGRSPISGFASRGRKRGTCTRGAGVGSRAEGQRSPAAGQAAVAVAPGEGWRAVTGGAMGMRLADRGPRAAAGGGHKKECPAPCSGPTAAALSPLQAPGPAPGPVAGAAVPVRGMGVGAEGRWFPMAGRRGDGAGAGAGGPRAGVMAGHQGWAALEDQGRKRSACDWCPVVRTRRPGRPPPGWSPSSPKMVNIFVGLSCFLIRLLLPPEPGYQFCLHEPI